MQQEPSKDHNTDPLAFLEDYSFAEVLKCLDAYERRYKNVEELSPVEDKELLSDFMIESIDASKMLASILLRRYTINFSTVRKLVRLRQQRDEIEECERKRASILDEYGIQNNLTEESTQLIQRLDEEIIRCINGAFSRTDKKKQK